MNSAVGTTFSVAGIRDESMLFTRLFEFKRSRDFISYEEIDEVIDKLNELPEELRMRGLDMLDNEFVPAVCLKCGKSGIFRFNLLGRLKHVECGAMSYVSTGYYVKRQVAATFANGIDAARDITKPDKNGETPGFFGKILLGLWGFTFGFVFRLVGSLIVVPIQIVAYLAQGEKLERIQVVQSNAGESPAEQKS